MNQGIEPTLSSPQLNCILKHSNYKMLEVLLDSGLPTGFIVSKIVVFLVGLLFFCIFAMPSFLDRFGYNKQLYKVQFLYAYLNSILQGIFFKMLKTLIGLRFYLQGLQIMIDLVGLLTVAVFTYLRQRLLIILDSRFNCQGSQ